MNRYILSDGAHVRHIKRIQHRGQVPALIVFGIFLWCSVVFPHIYLFHIASSLSIFWYITLALRYRIRHRIVQPTDDAVYSPITGKISTPMLAKGLRRISIHKKAWDVCELRCPKSGCHWDGDELLLDRPRMRFSFSARRIIRIPDAEMKVGNLIGWIPGRAVCTITTSENTPIMLTAKSFLEAGESRITLENTAT
ncbi:MAG: hypothetical protein PHQ29_02675 [Candidatus Cloacimonetes bacterium]|jgi:hypothetical protein|nr:hypothetical protein [Candidatus Cloacimonadota bacterium]MDD4486992.1 hypothetical protein [Proteiniphilum sp.]MDD4814369.1 hypothetical protein [Candidatus Cloacimonadota bacterium]HOA28948.1 hypothetical protein [Candidatus Cloacimonadota bacterium]